MVEQKIIGINDIFNVLKQIYTKKNFFTQMCKIKEDNVVKGQIYFDLVEHDGFHINIDGLETLPQYRNQGFASKIMDECVKFADQEKIILKLSTPIRNSLEVNNSLRKFYEKFGFVITEQIHNRHKMEFIP